MTSAEVAVREHFRSWARANMAQAKRDLPTEERLSWLYGNARPSDVVLWRTVLGDEALR